MHLWKCTSRNWTVLGLLLLAGPAPSIVQADEPVPEPALQIPREDSSEESLSPLEKLKRRSPARQWTEALNWQPQQAVTTKPDPAEPESKAAVPTPDVQPAITQPGRVGIGSLPQGEAVRFPRVASDVSKWRSTSDLTPRIAAIKAQLPQLKDPIRDPRDLKKLTDILPYSDYEPDPDIRRDDPCKFLCPRPSNAACQPSTADGVPMCPEIVSLADETYESRIYPESVFAWAASNVYHNPLYFEDPALERYGHTAFEPIQPFLSVGRFGVQLLGLPYQMSIDPVWKRQYALGWYRPGDCAPYKIYQIPWNTEAALEEAGVVTGMFFLFP